MVFELSFPTLLPHEMPWGRALISAPPSKTPSRSESPRFIYSERREWRSLMHALISNQSRRARWRIEWDVNPL